MKREIYLKVKNKAGMVSYQSFKKRSFTSEPVVSRTSIVISNMAFLGVLFCACVQFALQPSINEPAGVEEPALVNERGEHEQVTRARREIRSVRTPRKDKRSSSRVSAIYLFILYSNLKQSQTDRKFLVILKQYSVSSKSVFICFEN